MPLPLGRWLALATLTLLVAASVSIAAPLTCREIRSRMDRLKLTIRKATTKEAVVGARAELDRLAAQADRVCAAQAADKTGDVAPKTGVLVPVADLAPTPEEENKRRRDLINRGKAIPGLAGKGRTNLAMRAIPLAGSITIEGGTVSTLYGKPRQELSYTIRETFVGNLIVSGPDGRENYAIQTLSTEIDVERFSGRGCAKFAGSPPTCTHWQPLDLWQIADGEEYPGRADGVVSATGDGRGMVLRVDGAVIDFGSSLGSASIRSGCGGTLRETVSREEVRQWLRRSTVRIKREAGKASSGCRPGSSLTLELRIGSDS
ncbi:MAG: hypothetical protein LBD10_04420 [Desulfobulbus sp.]|jgi:hypothetical protein|uniref:hypothetical protein n=1 Tax=Desulfobulbus sp. TaxID=895 RepID=UPI0028433A70|nr:hypothetical protein [Desulfobulbus sp.]MDR2549433.1 hypothetical protein [Desulfobulbus sp.]